MSQLTPADCWPRRFPLLAGAAVLRGSHRAEQPLFAKASAGEAVAQLWQAPQGLVVPGSYRQFTDLPAISAHFAARGWPVWLRRSGGGLVPQGPGIINLSLAWPVQQPLGEAAEPIYHSLCAVLQRTLARFGVASHPGR
nr:Lipoate-protein ligase A [Klebsiella pneumoniae]